MSIFQLFCISRYRLQIRHRVGYNVMSLKEKQAAAKQTFVFLGSLANEYPAKQDVECDSTNS